MAAMHGHFGYPSDIAGDNIIFVISEDAGSCVIVAKLKCATAGHASVAEMSLSRSAAAQA
jgi:hypothetical protein